jgi:hypothetical protein
MKIHRRRQSERMRVEGEMGDEENRDGGLGNKREYEIRVWVSWTAAAGSGPGKRGPARSVVVVEST